METTGGIRRRRHRLLHACGVSALTIAHKACKVAVEVQGPIGFLSHRIASLASPIVGPMESQCLALLSFADDGILAVENMVETIFPSSAYVFDKIDSLVDIPDALPEKFDRVVDDVLFPVIIRRVPLLQWALTLFIWGLNLLFSIFFTDGRPYFAGAEEKEIIMVGTSPEQMMETINHAHDDNEDHSDPKLDSIFHNSPPPPDSPLVDEASMGKSPHDAAAAPVGEPEILETEEESKAIDDPSSSSSSSKDLPILELFDVGWHM